MLREGPAQRIGRHATDEVRLVERGPAAQQWFGDGRAAEAERRAPVALAAQHADDLPIDVDPERAARAAAEELVAAVVDGRTDVSPQPCSKDPLRTTR